jgi:hypothetical protein
VDSEGGDAEPTGDKSTEMRAERDGGQRGEEEREAEERENRKWQRIWQGKPPRREAGGEKRRKQRREGRRVNGGGDAGC